MRWRPGPEGDLWPAPGREIEVSEGQVARARDGQEFLARGGEGLEIGQGGGAGSRPVVLPGDQQDRDLKPEAALRQGGAVVQKGLVEGLVGGHQRVKAHHPPQDGGGQVGRGEPPAEHPAAVLLRQIALLVLPEPQERLGARAVQGPPVQDLLQLPEDRLGVPSPARGPGPADSLPGRHPLRRPEVHHLADAHIGGHLLRVGGGVEGAQIGPPGVAQQDHLFHAEVRPEEVHQLVQVGEQAFQGGPWGTRVLKVGVPTAPLVPVDHSAGPLQSGLPAIGPVGHGAARPAVEHQQHRMGGIPAPNLDILPDAPQGDISGPLDAVWGGDPVPAGLTGPASRGGRHREEHSRQKKAVQFHRQLPLMGWGGRPLRPPSGGCRSARPPAGRRRRPLPRWRRRRRSRPSGYR